MTDDDASAAHIDLCRRINRSAAVKYGQQGVAPADVAIAAAYSAVDLAQHHTGGDPASGIAWLRHVLDVLEDGLPLTVETVQ